MEKLLSITNLKKYFPVAKSSFFAKQMYVRANEDITLDIYKGETLGLVGESGCGKSTLGRVLLQLYEQTAGSTMYYGRTLDTVAPEYVLDTLKNAEKYVSNYHKAVAHAEEMAKKCNALGDKATFFDIQDKNLAACDAKTALDYAAKILGGFMVKDTAKGAGLLLNRYRHAFRAAALQSQIDEHHMEIEMLEGVAEDEPKKAASCEKKIKSHQAKINELENLHKAAVAATEEAEKVLAAERAKYADDPEFQKYEAMLDDGVDLKRLKYKEMRLLRKDLQIIFQDPYSSLNPRMTVGQIIGEGLTSHGIFKRGDPAMKEYIMKVMEDCGLASYMFNRYPHQFSGGQRQRIGIARAFILRPKLIICDEPVSALDVSIQAQVLNLLKELQDKFGTAYLFIAHDLSVVQHISDRVAVMYLGKMVELSDWKTLYTEPHHPYTQSLLSAVPVPDPDIQKTRKRIILAGDPPSPIDPPSGCRFHTRCPIAQEICSKEAPEFKQVANGHFCSCHFAKPFPIKESHINI